MVWLCLVITLPGWLATSCGGAGEAGIVDSLDSMVHHPLPDTLRVGTLYSPTSYFIYREQEMGYDYDLVRKFTADKGIGLEITVAHNLPQAIAMLDSGLIDLLAYEVPITAEYRSLVLPCGTENITHQVLVQPRRTGGEELITDVTQLVGREVYVEDESKYLHRLKNLNQELGGGIIIMPVRRDTLITEDLIQMVSDGEIPLTVVDSDIARLNKTYYRDLDITLEVSFPQRSAWGVSPGNAWLADSINAWAGAEAPRRERAQLLKRYYEKSKLLPDVYIMDFSSGKMSPFDALFKKYASGIGWDWRLLASMCYIESRFDSTQVSWAGARGIMQLMPATARAMGASVDSMAYNEQSIATACKVIKSLETSLKKYVPDESERKKFILAAYNSGLAHIVDAISLARKYKNDTSRWDGVVADALLMKSNPDYYNDPVCKYGYFRGRETFEYVRSVMAVYQKARGKISP